MGEQKKGKINVDHIMVPKTVLGKYNMAKNVKEALTNFNTIYGDVDGVKPNSTRSPVGTVGAICVCPDEHVFTRPVKTNALRKVPLSTNQINLHFDLFYLFGVGEAKRSSSNE